MSYMRRPLYSYGQRQTVAFAELLARKRVRKVGVAFSDKGGHTCCHARRQLMIAGSAPFARYQAAGAGAFAAVAS